MRTTAKPVVEALRAHILEAFDQDHYSAEEVADRVRCNNCMIVYSEDVNTCKKCGTDAFLMQPFLPTPLANLMAQIDSMRHHDRTTYQTALDYVEGGSLLIYYGDVQDFLKSIIGDDGRTYSDEKAWRLYCHLVAREITKLYKGAK